MKQTPGRGGRPRSRVGVGAEWPTIGARVRAARIALGAREHGALLSQTEFSERVSEVLGVTFHQTRLSRIEADQATATTHEVLALAVVADVSAAWLAFGFDVIAADAPSDEALQPLLRIQRAVAADLVRDLKTASEGEAPEPTVGSEGAVGSVRGRARIAPAPTGGGARGKPTRGRSRP